MKKFVGAVIGTGFGDEGKGLTVDYLCRKQGPGTKIVIRFNGGAQAGHTVVTPHGTRHVFSHFGSGSFAGASTMFSHFCHVDPERYLDERKVLEGHRAVEPELNLAFIADSSCYVVTPWDKILNQNLEKQRRRGSVGLGIGVTEFRKTVNLRSEIGILKRLMRCDRFTYLRDLRDRIRELDFEFEGFLLKEDLLSAEDKQMFEDDSMVQVFNDMLEEMFETVTVGYPGSYLLNHDVTIFEGAQGLMLDPDYNRTPHTTWSSCGVKNVLTLCNQFNMTLSEVVYVTRSYGTRHGEGPCYLYGDTEDLPRSTVEFFESLEDKTNTPHDYQGTLRKFPLDTDVVRSLIITDFKVEISRRFVGSLNNYHANSVGIRTKRMLTWAHLLAHPELVSRNGDDILLAIQPDYLAYGETAGTVSEAK